MTSIEGSVKPRDARDSARVYRFSSGVYRELKKGLKPLAVKSKKPQTTATASIQHKGSNPALPPPATVIKDQRAATKIEAAPVPGPHMKTTAKTRHRPTPIQQAAAVSPKTNINLNSEPAPDEFRIEERITPIVRPTKKTNPAAPLKPPVDPSLAKSDG